MKINKALLHSFRAKVTLILILSSLFVLGLSDLLIYKFSLDFQFNERREKLMAIASTASLMINGDLLMRIPLNKGGANTEEYKVIAQQLKRIKIANPPLKYVYTMVKTDKENIMQFVVDPDPLIYRRQGEALTSYPGDRYNAERCPQMLKAFEGPAADKKLTLDEWGVFLSGYAPVRNKAGEVVAILGVDNMAEDVYNMQREIRHRALFVLALGFLVSLAVGFLISSRITKPIKNLVELTRRIAAGDLHSRAELIGSDEIAELANSFNSMASSLYASRKRLHDYFYDVTQSLVRILEAKDHYTRGHSDRVADYSYKIALKMGLSQEKAELLKEAAEFHDIGKLGIQEGILNKKGKLTEEEWKIIQEHPVIGEDILRPVLLHEEMLAAIRSHHERFDGGGYPDKIAGDDINLFAQIVSVADAYDAMISPRAYRAAMKKEEAMAELKANSGTQFNPRAVETFLAILKEE